MSSTIHLTAAAPAPGGHLPDPVAGVLHRLVRGPAGKERDFAWSRSPRERTSRW